MLKMSTNYIRLEETRKAERELENSRQKVQSVQSTKKRSDDGRTDRGRSDLRPAGRREDRPFAGTLDLAVPQAEVYEKIKGKVRIEAPEPIRTPQEKRDSKRFCEFHKEIGHTTDQCRALAYELERLVKQGKLKEFLKKGRKISRSPERRDRDQGRTRRRSPIKSPSPRREGRGGSPQILVVHAPSTFKNARKRDLEELKRESQSSTSRPRTCEDEEEVKFIIQDAQGIKTPHEDALMISPKIADHRVHRVLIDNGCAVNVIYYSYLEKMGIQRKDLQPSKATMMGFSGEKGESEGEITLSVVVGDN